MAALLRRLEPDDEAVVVGGGADGAAFLLAAHDVPVTFLAGDLGSVDRVESRVEDESLAVQILATVVDFELWCPPLPDVIAITGDHSTPSVLKVHSWHPVPLLLWAPGATRRDGAQSFGETECLKGALGIFAATDLMPLALAHAGRLQKFGA